MEWTREQRYLPYDQHSALELLELQRQADNSPEQLKYHIRPSSGLLNEPNGFSYFNHEWHVFYQSFSFGAAHGLKSWMHMTSPDLVHWRDHGLALCPDTEFDSHGAYSGSARVVDGRLCLMYTGNHRDDDWVRTPYQLGAWMDHNYQVTKFDQPLFVNPTNITEHFRDPQLLEHDGKYYAIIGSQDVEQKNGHIDLWASDQLEHGWHEVGHVQMGTDDLGYMVECPNLITVDGRQVMIFCPQGLDHQTASYDNIYPDMYLTAEGFDYDAPAMITPDAQMQNLDDGFDVYATQAMNTEDGKAYAISWVGLPDLTYPTDDQNWANCMSQVKELHFRDGQLYQTPVAAMRDLRQTDQAQTLDGQVELINSEAGQQFELAATIKADQVGTLHLAAKADLSKSVAVNFDTEAGKLTIDRGHTDQPTGVEYGTTRTLDLPAHQALKLDIFVDHSLVEVFVNDGTNVMTLRYFNSQAYRILVFDRPVDMTGTYWPLSNM